MIQDKNRRIILLTNETKNNVIIYDKSGKLLSTWGTEYPGAHGLTLFNENGEDVLFICDNALHQVIKTTIDGKVLMKLDYPKETGEYSKAEEYILQRPPLPPMVIFMWQMDMGRILSYNTIIRENTSGISAEEAQKKSFY
jgi:hypothetical protein